jgi:hypothetical protein
MPSRHLALALAVLVVAVWGCSFLNSSGSISNSSGSISDSSASSESISTSMSSLFKSSSGSSGNSQDAYRSDIRDYTASYVRSGGDFDAFERKIGSVAAQHGITDWELDDNTYLAIGQGFRKGGLKPIKLAAWKSNLARDDLSRAQLIQKGYDGTP